MRRGEAETMVDELRCARLQRLVGEGLMERDRLSRENY